MYGVRGSWGGNFITCVILEKAGSTPFYLESHLVVTPVESEDDPLCSVMVFICRWPDSWSVSIL